MARTGSGSVMTPKFGDKLENPVASVENPHRIGMFVRKVRRTGKLNPGLWYEMTDGTGDFWLSNPACLIPLPSCDLWQVTVRVPLSLSVEMRNELFGAVVDAVAAWEPPDRDGWDADVSGAPAHE
jgi:hypothetical protein